MTYSIASLTADEAYLAGASNINSTYFLYTKNIFWLMTPYHFSNVAARVRRVNSDGRADGTSYMVSDLYGVRPVINVKANTFQNGDGTALNPYRE